MALLEYVTVDEAEGAARDTMEAALARTDDRDRIPFYEVLAHNPQVVESRSAYHRRLMEGGDVDRRTKELVYVAVSAANACEFCAASHGRRLFELGEAEDVVDAVRAADLESLPADERAVVDFARQTALDPKRVSGRHVEALRAAGFADADVVELLAVAASAVAANVIVDAMDVSWPDVGLEDPVERAE